MKRVIGCILAVVVLGACGKPTRRAPELVESPPAQPGPPKRDLLKEAGDTTWNVVTAPVRLIKPAPKPRPIEEEPTEPPSATIIRRTYGEDEVPSTRPAR